MTFSNLPSGAEEVSMRKLRLDVRSELFAGGAVSHVVGSGTTFVLARVKLTDDESLAFLHVPHQSTRVSLVREDLGSVAAGVVDADLDGSDTDRVLGEGDKTSVSTDGKARSIAVFSNHDEALVITVDIFGDCELVQSRPAFDPEPPLLGELESGRTTSDGIEQLIELLRGVLRA